MPSVYEGAVAALATLHGKEAAIAPPFGEILGLCLKVPTGIDTDALGTFTGEIARHGSMQETAVAKARLGMAAAGLSIGVASEGSYGPHPAMPFIPLGIELIALVDDARGIVVVEQMICERTNFDHTVVAATDDLSEFTSRVGFPDHGLIVRPNQVRGSLLARAARVFGGKLAPPPGLVKGIRDPARLVTAVAEASCLSDDGCARVETDMRAHLNPTRLAAIGKLAARLAARLATPCPRCCGPGFGRTGELPGLPCEACGGATSMIRAEVFTCPGCSHSEHRPRFDGLTQADAMWCDHCNP